MQREDSMKRLLALITLLCFLVAGCATKKKDVVYQTSTIDALLAGVYDGQMSCKQLLRHGDFGIGTFDGLDGEMLVLDGNVYQVKADGRVYQPDASVNTPFATVCRFDPDQRFPIERGVDFEKIEHVIDQHAFNRNIFYAVRIDGRFRKVRTRSVPRQNKPYPPLSEVTQSQPEFEASNISGSIVGFRCPSYVKGVNVPGYHLHFISTDRSMGGHILSFEIDHAECEIDALNQYYLSLPEGDDAFSTTDLSRDRSEELEKVER